MEDIRRITNRCYLKLTNNRFYLYDIITNQVLAVFDKVLGYDPNAGVLTVSIIANGIYQNYILENTLSGEIHFYGDKPSFDEEWNFYRQYGDGDNLSVDTIIKEEDENFFDIIDKATKYMDDVAKKAYEKNVTPPLFDNQTSYTM